MSEEEKKAIEDLKNNIEYAKKCGREDTYTNQETIYTVLNLIQKQQIQIDEKDKIIDEMAEFMNKRSWKEHQLKDEICHCCKVEYSSDECINCVKQYFEKKVEEDYGKRQ